MGPQEQLGYILPTLSSVVDRIDPRQMHDRVPGRRDTVHDVLDELFVLAGTFTAWFSGEDASEVAAPPVYGWVPAVQFREAMDELLAAVKAPGAMDRTITSSIGTLPGETFARMVAADAARLGRDLVGATGLRFVLPPAVIADIEAFAERAADQPELVGATGTGSN